MARQGSVKKRDWVGLIATSVAIGLFWGMMPDFMGGLVEAAWWDVLPWVLLALLWIGFGILVWRGRHSRSARQSEKRTDER